MKLLYTIPATYRPAGMERVLANKANWFAARGYEIVVVTTDQHGRKPAFAFDPSIRMIDLGIGYEDNNGGSFASKILRYPGKQLRHRIRLSRVLKAEKADVVISMFGNDAAFVPRIKDGSRKVLEIHFSRFKRLQYGRSGLWALADRFRSWNDKRVASRFDSFVVLTNEDRGYWGDMPNIRVIPNARTFEPLPLQDKSNKSVRTVLAAGRLNFQKAFDRLLDVWVVAKTGGWRLRIVGDGELRAELQDRAERLGIAGSVTIGPSDRSMVEEYADADIYAMTSLYEGLPMVLLEAQAAGLPIVSVPCKCGPRDVITDGVDGYICELPDFPSRLRGLMDDEELRDRMGRAALTASERFAEDRIMAMWTELFEELTR